jgi:hypothetical protein
MHKTTKLRAEWINDNGPCSICGSDKELHLHHEDPNSKIEHRLWGMSKKRREEELQKCIVVCKECHVDIHTDLKRQGFLPRPHKDRKLILCTKCGKERPVGAKGLCHSCYRRYQRDSKYIICKECKQEKHPYTKDLCNACYSRIRRANPPKRKMIICSDCGTESWHEAKGKCKKCYIKNHPRKMCVCIDCGENKPHHSKNRCVRCYMRSKRQKQ